MATIMQACNWKSNTAIYSCAFCTQLPVYPQHEWISWLFGTTSTLVFVPFFWNNLCLLKFCRYVLSLFLSFVERPLHVICPTSWNDNVFLAIVIPLSVHIEMTCLSRTPEHYTPIIVYRWLKNWITWQLHFLLWIIKQHGFKWYCTEKHRRSSKEIWMGKASVMTTTMMNL